MEGEGTNVLFPCVVRGSPKTSLRFCLHALARSNAVSSTANELILANSGIFSVPHQQRGEGQTLSRAMISRPVFLKSKQCHRNSTGEDRSTEKKGVTIGDQDGHKTPCFEKRAEATESLPIASQFPQLGHHGCECDSCCPISSERLEKGRKLIPW